MKLKLFFGRLVIAIFGGAIALILFVLFVNKDEKMLTVSEPRTIQLSNFMKNSGERIDLTRAAESSVKSVVHVKTLYTKDEYHSNPFYDFLFGNSNRRSYNQPSLGSGSGVIVSDDGYIVTNNHVVKGSNLINVVLHDKRSYEAKLIGQDPYTDLALIKIEEKQLPAMNFGNSDELKLGEWVLAVGNPFNLTSTVTAGIISAKARKIGIMNDKMSIESFLQTDAAVNPGNSGGALVDAKGELVGINTAIESRTGSYSGYSFAIPVSIVEKVISDLKEFGKVQRAMLGVSIQTVDANLAETQGLNKIEGVYVAELTPNGAADEAGMKSGDVILEIHGKPVNSGSELQEQISKYRPGDAIKVSVKRNGKNKEFDVVLRNRLGSTKAIPLKVQELLGADFKPIGNKEKYRLQINRGVKVTKLRNGKLKNARIKEGYIIYNINDTPIYKVEDIEEALQNVNEGVFISGIYPNGSVKYYALSFNDDE